MGMYSSPGHMAARLLCCQGSTDNSMFVGTIPTVPELQPACASCVWWLQLLVLAAACRYNDVGSMHATLVVYMPPWRKCCQPECVADESLLSRCCCWSATHCDCVLLHDRTPAALTRCILT
jgi:hypothetical protein